MKVVLSWLREFAPTDMDPDELAELITHRGVKVEEVLRPWAGLEGVVVARVLDVNDHPDSDKLCVARVDDGTGEQVVCAGVRNFEAGDLVPWAKPGARVPALDEPLAPRSLRGVVSNGMLCSLRELAIADTHEGILVFDAREGLQAGDDVKAALGLDDAVFDIEVEPNRPDFLSVFGVAREVAAATGVALLRPESPPPETEELAAEAATVRLDAAEGCPDYIARIIRGVDAAGASPLRAQARLTASGMRPVSVIVDATNYAMLELGQPLHAFDIDRLNGPGIVVRYAEEGEHLTTLDDIDRALTSEDLLICDVERPVAIAGVMGGASSEVSGTTTGILLESAYFTRAGVLRTARRLDLHSEASHRFERGTDPEGLERGASRCSSLIAEWAGGAILQGVARDGEAPPRRWVSMRPSRASHLLGYAVPSADAEAVFSTLDLKHRADGDAIDVEVPGYRVDIEREVDLIEEIARVQGYDRIGAAIPSAGQVGGVPPSFAFRQRLRDAMVRTGLREVRLLSFASGEDLTLIGEDDGEPIAVANPLQADDGFLRTSLLPGLLRAVARNQGRGSEAVTVFEIGTVFRHGAPVDEREKIAFALTGPAGEGWDVPDRSFDVLDAKGVLEALMTELGVADWSLGEPLGVPFHPARSARVAIGDRSVGVLGELAPTSAGILELTGRVACAEFEVDAISRAGTQTMELHDVPRFPPIRRDLAFEVSEDVPAGQVHSLLMQAAGPLLSRCTLFDVFTGAPLAEGSKSLAFAIEFRAPDRTLTNEEADPLIASIVERLAEKVGARLRAG